MVSIICVSGGTLSAVDECLGIIHHSLKRARDIMEVALGRPTFHVRVGSRSFAAQVCVCVWGGGGICACVCVCVCVLVIWCASRWCALRLS